MTTRNLLLAGTIVAGPLLSLLISNGVARAETAPMLRMAQAEPAPGEQRRERPAPAQAPAPQQREAPPQAQPPRAAPPAPPQQREAPPAPRAEPPRAEPPRAEPPRAAPPAPREAPAAPRVEPPRQQVAPQAAPERREAPQAAPEGREPPRAEPPRERPQTPPGLERRETPPPGLERREAPQPQREAPPRVEPVPPRAEPPRSVTPPTAPAERPAVRPEARPETAPALRPTAPAVPPSATQSRPDLGGARPDATPGQRPVAPAVPPSATQTRPDLGAPTPQQRPNTPSVTTTSPGVTQPNALQPNALQPNVSQPNVSQPTSPQQSLAPPLPRGEQLPAGRVQNGERRVEERDGRTYIRENDNRLIIREGGRDIIRHDEVQRLQLGARNVDVQQRPNGRREIVILQPDGDRIVTIVDADGNLLRRERRARDGRNYVLIENDFDRPRGGFYRPVELPPLRLSIPRERYIVEAEDQPYTVIEETLMAPPVERVERPYSLDEVRYNQRLREKMSRVDVDTINFALGSAEVDPNGAARLDSIARALTDAIRRNPNEVFLIEGHTDAVGGDTENLTLSDRRAEAVAAILTERYQIPPENLVTQGYGEQFLKVQTDAPERQNRRVTVRRITPLLQQGQNQAPAPR